MRARTRATKTLAYNVAIVSGSGRGIGRAIALKLASEGAKVVVNYLDVAPAEQTVADIKAAGGVTCDGFAEKFVNTAIEALAAWISSSTRMATPGTA